MSDYPTESAACVSVLCGILDRKKSDIQALVNNATFNTYECVSLFKYSMITLEWLMEMLKLSCSDESNSSRSEVISFMYLRLFLVVP